MVGVIEGVSSDVLNEDKPVGGCFHPVTYHVQHTLVMFHTPLCTHTHTHTSHKAAWRHVIHSLHAPSIYNIQIYQHLCISNTYIAVDHRSFNFIRQVSPICRGEASAPRSRGSTPRCRLERRRALHCPPHQIHSCLG